MMKVGFGFRTPGSLLPFLRDGKPFTRSHLTEQTGLSRSSVDQRVDALMALGLVVEDGKSRSTGGRQATRLRFAGESGAVLVADLGVTHALVAITDLAGRILDERRYEQRIDAGPGEVLGEVVRRFEQLLEKNGFTRAELRGIGVGVPGPVSHSLGHAVSPPSMPGWDGYSIPADLGRQFGGVPCLVDNDVNIMTVGEYSLGWADTVSNMLFVKIASGIGCGVIIAGQLHRGEDGSAGDIGHSPVQSGIEVICRCGNLNCLGAVAGGYGIAQRLSSAGIQARDARAVAQLVTDGQPDAIREVRNAGRDIGLALSAAVNLLNPGVLVIGGDLAQAHDPLLAGIREMVYQRSLPMATRQLRLVTSKLGDRAGIHGAAVMVLNHVLAPGAVDDLIQDMSRAATRAAEAKAHR